MRLILFFLVFINFSFGSSEDPLYLFIYRRILERIEEYVEPKSLSDEAQSEKFLNFFFETINEGIEAAALDSTVNGRFYFRNPVPDFSVSGILFWRGSLQNQILESIRNKRMEIVDTFVGYNSNLTLPEAESLFRSTNGKISLDNDGSIRKLYDLINKYKVQRTLFTVAFTHKYKGQKLKSLSKDSKLVDLIDQKLHQKKNLKSRIIEKFAKNAIEAIFEKVEKRDSLESILEKLNSLLTKAVNRSIDEIDDPMAIYFDGDDIDSVSNEKLLQILNSKNKEEQKLLVAKNLRNTKAEIMDEIMSLIGSLSVDLVEQDYVTIYSKNLVKDYIDIKYKDLLPESLEMGKALKAIRGLDRFKNRLYRKMTTELDQKIYEANIEYALKQVEKLTNRFEKLNRSNLRGGPLSDCI